MEQWVSGVDSRRTYLGAHPLAATWARRRDFQLSLGQHVAGNLAVGEAGPDSAPAWASNHCNKSSSGDRRLELRRDLSVPDCTEQAGQPASQMVTACTADILAAGFVQLRLAPRLVHVQDDGRGEHEQPLGLRLAASNHT